MSAEHVEEESTKKGEEGQETNKERRLARKAEKQAKRKAYTDPEVGNDEQEIKATQSNGADYEAELQSKEGEEEVEAVSHKEMRKRRKLEKQATRLGHDATGSVAGPPVHPSRALAVASANAVSSGPIRSSRHSVWVGNMSFRTNAERLQEWFEEKGVYGISRVNMPKGPKKTDNNRGFAYVDVPTADAVQSCIDLSESHLDGRKLLIKSGTDYSGRPEIDKTALALASGLTTSAPLSSANATEGVAAPESTDVPQKGKTGLTKTAQKILRAQKHVPGPTLFVGNLSFNSTEDGVRELVERSAAARDEWSSQKDKKKGGDKVKKNRREKDVDQETASDSGSSSSSSSSEGESSDDDEQADEDDSNDDEGNTNDGVGEKDVKTSRKEKKSKKNEGLRGAGIRKIRMGQFEDTGKCKGFAFIDFFSPEYATASLIDPRNSRLDGRELTLQYAGADAIRRGAPKGQISHGPRPRRDNQRGPPKRPFNDAFETQEATVDLGPAPEPGTFDPDAPMPKKHKETKEERIKRREIQNASSTKRAKPGAALANAPRGKMGIEFNAPKGVKKTFD
ncbi:hypothetical protein CBS101457_003786 [Exobasidium rhododendri]|nr:hypothetical protein CBS101457_003786 [Exobasidium rhododendri]